MATQATIGRPRDALGITPRGFALGLVCVLGVAGWIRGATCGESLWLDELHTAWSVAGSFEQVAPRAAAGNQGPVYFWLVWAMTRVVGDSELGLRCGSWLSGLALIALLGESIRRRTRSAHLGWLVAIFATIDPHCIYFSREARPYALVMVLALCQVQRFLARWVRPTWKNRLGWIGLTCVLFYTHYTSLLLLPAEVAFLITFYATGRTKPSRRGFAWAIDLMAVALGCAVALPHLNAVGARRQDWAQFVEQVPWTRIGSLFPCSLYVGQILVLTVGLLLATRALEPRRRIRRRFGWGEVWLAVWYLVPITLAWVLTRTDEARLFFRRYLVVALLPLLIHPGWCGLVLRGRGPRQAYFWCAVALAVISIRSPSAAIWNGHSQENWRDAVALIRNDTAGRSWPVFVPRRAHRRPSVAKQPRSGVPRVLPVPGAGYLLAAQSPRPGGARRPAPDSLSCPTRRCATSARPVAYG